MLSSLDERISPSDLGSNEDQILTRYHAQAMHLCSQRFEGAVDISRMVTQIVQSTPIQLPIRPQSSTTKTNSALPDHTAGYWDDLFVTRNYMKLRLSLDYALITGRPPTDIDLPSSLLQGTRMKRLTMGPINSLSAITLPPSRKRRASESVAGLPRVVELDESSTHHQVEEGTMDDIAVRDQQPLFGKEGNTLSRPFFDYDTIWAASLFEEVTDQLWA